MTYVLVSGPAVALVIGAAVALAVPSAGPAPPALFLVLAAGHLACVLVVSSLELLLCGSSFAVGCCVRTGEEGGMRRWGRGRGPRRGGWVGAWIFSKAYLSLSTSLFQLVL